MKKFLILIVFVLLSIPSKSQDITEETLLKAMHTISSHDLLDYVKIQCDEKYKGRLTGTNEYLDCANWLAGEFDNMGLIPAGDNGGWFQWFKIPYTLVYPDCGLTLHIPVSKDAEILKHYKYVSEYMPGSTSGNGEIKGEVVYAGFGITAPELNYDDYKGIDVKGKIVLIEPEAPVSPNEGAEKFTPWYKYSFHQHKLANAVNHGAIGMIYNFGPIGNPNNDYYENFVYVYIGDSVVNDIFAGTGYNHGEHLKQIISSLKPGSFNTKKVVTVKMSSQHFPDGTGSNIIGILEGNDPVLKQETIIIAAHLDHLGMLYEMIPGANDNASGVAVMMGLARALAENKIPLKRTVMFIAFGSEEQAVMGSYNYLQRPVRPLDKSVLINMDCVGIGNSIRAVAGVNYPILWSFFEEANKKYIHRPLSTSYFSNLGRPRLDAARFLTEGVPSLSFSTYGSVNYYHIPLDNLDIIKPEIMEDMCKLLFTALVRMANSDEPLRD